MDDIIKELISDICDYVTNTIDSIITSTDNLKEKGSCKSLEQEGKQ